MNNIVDIIEKKKREIIMLFACISTLLLLSLFYQQTMGLFNKYKQYKAKKQDYVWLKQQVEFLTQYGSLVKRSHSGIDYESRLESLKTKEAFKTLQWVQEAQQLNLSFNINRLSDLNQVIEAIVTVLELELAVLKLDFKEGAILVETQLSIK